MTITTDTYTIVGVGVALAGMILVSGHQQSREVSELRQQVTQQIAQQGQQIAQQGQQITRIAQEVGRLSGLLDGLRGRPFVEQDVGS